LLTLLKGAEFFRAGMKVQRDEGDGRILLGDNTGGGTVRLWPIKLRCVGVWISTILSYIYIYIWP